MQCRPCKLSVDHGAPSNRMSGFVATVAILAQGTSWAVAVTQAFFGGVQFPTCTFAARSGASCTCPGDTGPGICMRVRMHVMNALLRCPRARAHVLACRREHALTRKPAEAAHVAAHMDFVLLRMQWTPAQELTPRGRPCLMSCRTEHECWKKLASLLPLEKFCYG